MDRLDFLKAIGLGATGLIFPKNDFFNTKTVRIYDNYVRGLTHYQFKAVHSQIKEGDPLTLVREISNEYDSFAIAVFYQNQKMGYIAAYENIILANMIDAGVQLSAFVSKISPPQAEIFTALAVAIHADLIIPSPKLIQDLLTDKRADDATDKYRMDFYYNEGSDFT